MLCIIHIDFSLFLWYNSIINKNEKTDGIKMENNVDLVKLGFLQKDELKVKILVKNNLPLSEYDCIFGLNSVFRPNNGTLKGRFYDNPIVLSKVQELASFWDSFFENSQTVLRENQVEEWIEDALLFKETLAQFSNVYISCEHKGFSKIPDELKKLPYIGRIPGLSFSSRYEKNSNLDDDLVFPELKEALGREIQLAKADFDDIMEVSQKMLEKHSSIFLKWLGEGKIYPVVRLKSISDVEEWFFDDPFMIETQHSNQLTIQEGLNLVDETRFFVVAGEIVSSSRVNWFYTPLHEPKNDYISESMKNVIEKKAKEVIEILKNGNSLRSQTYVLDIGFDCKYERPVVIELNAIHNSGLYANDVKKIVQAVKKHPGEFVLEY